MRLQEEGVAAVSDTTVRGEHCLRVAINNHRTRATTSTCWCARLFASGITSSVRYKAEDTKHGIGRLMSGVSFASGSRGRETY